MKCRTIHPPLDNRSMLVRDWFAPLFQNNVFVLGFDSEGEPEFVRDVELLFSLMPSSGDSQRLALCFWQGTDSLQRIDAYVVAKKNVPADVIVWEVCVAWLYEAILSNQDSLLEIIGDHPKSVGTRLYTTAEAFRVLRYMHAYSRSVAAAHIALGVSEIELRSIQDECVRFFDFSHSVLGISTTPDGRIFRCPVECPWCGFLFLVDEVLYRGWRDNELPCVWCPRCRNAVRTMSMRTATCAMCHNLTGLLPISLAEEMERGTNTSLCSNCLILKRTLVEELIKARVSEPQPRQSAAKGCLVLVAATTILIPSVLLFVLNILPSITSH